LLESGADARQVKPRSAFGAPLLEKRQLNRIEVVMARLRELTGSPSNVSQLFVVYRHWSVPRMRSNHFRSSRRSESMLGIIKIRAVHGIHMHAAAMLHSPRRSGFSLCVPAAIEGRLGRNLRPLKSFAAGRRDEIEAGPQSLPI
jgi:hypothetical protein